MATMATPVFSFMLVSQQNFQQLIGQVMYILLHIYNYCSNKHCKKQENKSIEGNIGSSRNRTVESLRLSELGCLLVDI